MKGKFDYIKFKSSEKKNLETLIAMYEYYIKSEIEKSIEKKNFPEKKREELESFLRNGEVIKFESTDVIEKSGKYYCIFEKSKYKKDLFYVSIPSVRCEEYLLEFVFSEKVKKYLKEKGIRFARVDYKVAVKE